MARYLLTTHWTGGDVYPFIRLGKALKDRGHEIILYTHCVYKEKAEELGFVFEPWDTREEYERLFQDMILSQDALNNPEGFKTFRARYQSKERRLREIGVVKKYLSDDLVIIGKCRSTVGAMLASEKYNIPFVTLYMGPAHILFMKFFGEIFGAGMCEEINDIRHEIGLKPIEDWYTYVTSGKKNIALWPKWFGRADNLPEWEKELSLHYAGFPLDDELEGGDIPAKIVEILEKDPSPVLITGGTSDVVNPAFYEVTAQACALLGKQGILVTKYDKLVPDNLPDCVTRFSFLNFAGLMEKMGVVIHHGGMGTLSRILMEGVPQVVMAHLTDGPENAGRLAYMGIAVSLHPREWTAKIVAENIQTVLTEEFQQKAAEFRQQMKEIRCIENVCDQVESVVGNQDYIIEEKPGFSTILVDVCETTQGTSGKNVGKNSVHGTTMSEAKRALLLKLAARKRKNQ